MRSSDVVSLYNTVGIGAKVQIVNEPLPLPDVEPATQLPGARIATAVVTERAAQ
jgi:hypothetical protein